MRCSTCEKEYVDDGTIRYRSGKLEALSEHVMSLGGKVCRYCGRPAGLLTLVVPGARGGCECVENLVAACDGCDAMRGDMLHSEWRLSLRGQIRAKGKRDTRFLDRCVQILWHWDGQ